MDIVHAFSKGVKDTNVAHQTISDFGVIGRIAAIIERLESLHNSQHCPIQDIEFNPNRREWLLRLLEYPTTPVDESIVRFLLHDFTENMRTRMLQQEKYVIGVLSANRLLLSHSIYGGETITPSWETIPRMLDTDNALRFASFRKDQDSVNLTYWERDPSQSFIEWLGLKRKKVFSSGGAFRIVSQIDGIVAELQCDEKQIEELIQNHPEFSDNKITLHDPVSILPIEEIKVGSRHYDNSEDFLQVYKADRYGVIPYVQAYSRLVKSYSPVVIKYFDDETQVISRPEPERQTIEVQKDLEGVEVLFVQQYIELTSMYRNKLVAKIMNNDGLRLFHAGCEFEVNPYVLKNIQVLNKIKTDGFVIALTDYYSQTSLQDKTLDGAIKYAIFNRLAIINSDSPIAHLFRELTDGILKTISGKERKWTKGEDAVIEYKSSDSVKGNNAAVIADLASDMKTKLAFRSFKIYVVGMEENEDLNPPEKSKLQNDRVEAIRSGVANELEALGQIQLWPVRVTLGNKCLLFLVVKLGS